jgi:hypothetical protein
MKHINKLFQESITMSGVVKSHGKPSAEGDYPTTILIEDGEHEGKYITPWLPTRFPRESTVQVDIINPDSEYPQIIVNQ